MEHLSKINKWHNTYIQIASTIALHSYANRNKVGAILVKDNRIISMGYNGTPSGFDNNCEDDYNTTKAEVLHAESNCISKCAKSTESSNGSTLYVTLAPCLECSKLIIQCGIKNVYYKEEYRNKEGLILLKKANIYVEKI
jgi:dCMP deaminase